MEQMIAGPNRQGMIDNWADWHYLTEEEQDALIAGFKEMKRAKFDKQTMERVFDEEYVQRQIDFMHRKATMQLRPKTTQPQQPPVQPFQTMTTNTTNSTTGLLAAIGLGGLFGGGQ
jgi:hypothetical protein